MTKKKLWKYEKKKIGNYEKHQTKEPVMKFDQLVIIFPLIINPIGFHHCPLIYLKDPWKIMTSHRDDIQ